RRSPSCAPRTRPPSPATHPRGISSTVARGTKQREKKRMTEAVQKQGSAEPKRSGRGAVDGGSVFAKNALAIERVYTTPGVHPYDEVTWERRDVVMTNWRDGSINFEQRGVEFPDFWAVNAANIVTTKYFRGAVGTDAREWSLRQLIDRVVKTYR